MSLGDEQAFPHSVFSCVAVYVAGAVAGTVAPCTNALHITTLCDDIVSHGRGDEVLALQVVELLLRPPPLLRAARRSGCDQTNAGKLVSSAVAVASERDDWRIKLPAVVNGMRLPNVPMSHQIRATELGNECSDKDSALIFGDVPGPAPSSAPEPESEPTGADANAAALGGLRALHIAAVEGRCSVVQALIAAKAELNARLEPTNESAFNLAVAAGHADVARVLEAAGCDTKFASWPIKHHQHGSAVEAANQSTELLGQTEATVEDSK